ncbi:MAG: hypothetical protein IPN44_15875 [Flavobacteriales bacterium]|nr:hypothetical protein [Flavobacteriales bacterium]
MNTRRWTEYLPWVTLFAVAMGFLESAVVVYLRAIYYPAGFSFPLAVMAPKLVFTELLREVATMIMLLAPGALISRGRLERFAWFCWSFAIWDLFYYVFLKLLLDWPESLFTWDVLFLLPTVWVGPVLAPCIISFGLLFLAAIILARREREPGYRLTHWQWVLLVLAALVYFLSFIEGPLTYLRSVAAGTSYVLDGATTLGQYLPTSYRWSWFVVATLLAIAGMAGSLRAPFRNFGRRGRE